MKTIIAVTPNDFGQLADLEIRSESYWNYSEEFMNKFKENYLITEEFIANNVTFILKDKDEILGFYGILQKGKEASLEYLFIEPSHIGKGYGKMLWEHALIECKKLGIQEFRIITSPDARGFYFRMGATIIGQADLLISKGSKTPVLIYRL